MDQDAVKLKKLEDLCTAVILEAEPSLDEKTWRASIQKTLRNALEAGSSVEEIATTAGIATGILLVKLSETEGSLKS